MHKSHTQRAPQTKWIQVPKNLQLNVPFLKAVPLRPIGSDAVQYEAITQRGPIKLQIPNNQSFLVSNGQIYDDMCNMDILNQPEILNNLVSRYKKSQIFTFIGPTLIIVNPYRFLPQYFSPESLARIRAKILSSSTSSQPPHIYLIAGNAYTSMMDQQKKQAIVISGQSGAGKTQSTKYCMQILTSLSACEHGQEQGHNQLGIEGKILACNPILEAFGNSKTMRNDNSSRFGKYVRIYFGGDVIKGASIRSYLLEKSRVVAVGIGERNFHAFYAVIASGSFGLGKPSQYQYLAKSKCYEATGINDKEYFFQIKKSMDSIGFSSKEQDKIWQLLCSILQLGNIQFDDAKHKQNQSNPCQIKNKKAMEKVASILSINEPDLQKILLFQRKKIIKQISFSAYSKSKCLANINTLSKAIYNAIFQFILYKIQRSLQPAQTKNYLSINILDIFGFQNFQVNSFQQFCINYTNQKLLKLYNKYVFQKQMQILREDGLYDQVSNIKPPTNDAVIEIISGKLSLFSIINDLTMPQQFKDKDMVQGFENKLGTSPYLKFDILNKSKFVIVHSQCNVKYEIEGFKEKNQDKVLPEILDIVNNLFEHDSREQSGKTILTKFQTEIEDLMNQLNSSCVHFIRCIKPNEKKVPNLTQQQFMITQIRYLGVFETIQIRKKTFPSRWLYEEFLQRFQSLFPISNGTAKSKTEKIMKTLTSNQNQFLLGNKRVYMNSDIETKLSKKLHEQMKKKVESGKKIWKSYKKYKFKKQVKIRLKLLVKRIRIWKAISAREVAKIYKNTLPIIKAYVLEKKKQQQKLLMNKKLIEAKSKRQEEQKKRKQLNVAKKNQNQFKHCDSIIKIIGKIITRDALNKMKSVTLKSDKNFSKSKNFQSINNYKHDQNYSSTNGLSDSVLNESVIMDSRQNYKREQSQTEQRKTSFQFNESFINNQSVLQTNDKNIIFQGTLSVRAFNPKQAHQLQKLKLILAEKYQTRAVKNQEDYYSPPSDDAVFEIQQTDDQIMNKIVAFDSKEFFKEVLRIRKNFFGIEKDEDDILVCKAKPLSKSLTLINQNDEKQAIRIFKSLLKISEQARLDNVFKLIQVLIGFCHGTSPQLKNEVFIQLLKQSNSQIQLSSVRIMQAFAVFLHIFNPDKNFIMAGLNFYFKRLAQQRFTQKQCQYAKYIFKKMLRKLQRPNTISYMPIKYQMMALMCKRKITLPIYLPIGSFVLIKIESHQTFADIKLRVMQQFGIDTNRLLPQFFTFFQIVNFDNQELEESPIHEHLVVWDIVTYWEKAKDKYKEKGIMPPTFFMMLKIRYTYECHYSDEESVQIMFGQAYFQYFVGRVRLPLDQIGFLGACVRRIKFNGVPISEYRLFFPSWVMKKYGEEDILTALKIGIGRLDKQGLDEYDVKYMYLGICAKSPFCMCLAVGTDQNVRIYLKPKKIIITDKFQIVDDVQIKSITKYAQNSEQFIYSVRGSSQSKIVFTEHASIVCQFLSLLPNLVKLKIDSKNSYKHNNNSILGDLK